MSKSNEARNNALYHMSLSFARKWAQDGLLTVDEYCDFEKYLREKYHPILPVLSPKHNLTSPHSRANVTKEGK